MSEAPLPDVAPAPARCAVCSKPARLCVCAELTPHQTKLQILILQHPQEQDVDLGTAKLITGQLPNAKLKVGLSWPNLAKAVGRVADPKRWAVLYLGPASASGFARGSLTVVDKKALPVPDQEEAVAGLEGIVVLDGTWSQAKTLWWRNPWLLKLRRLIVIPDRPSAYGELRREPRKESLSTLESVGFALSRLEGDPSLYDLLVAPFRTMLQRYRAGRSRGAAPRPKPPAA